MSHLWSTVPSISSSEQIPWGNLKDYGRMVDKLQGNVYLCEWGRPWSNNLYSIFFFNLAESLVNHQLRTAEHLKLEYLN
jgi:hypothetical protein